MDWQVQLDFARSSSSLKMHNTSTLIIKKPNWINYALVNLHYFTKLGQFN